MCPDPEQGGRFEIELDELKYWEINKDKLVELGYYEEPKKADSKVTKLASVEFAKNLAEAYGLDIARVRVELNRAANKDPFLRTELKDTKARGPKFVYETKRAKPILEELKKKHMMKQKNK